MLIAGAGFFLYPDIANWWNGRSQSTMVTQFYEDVAAMQQEELDNQLQRARDFNATLRDVNIEDPFADAADLPYHYMETLNVGGVMARIQIPRVNVDLPVLHGTSHSVLDTAAGHLAGTSFPIGGPGTHAVITAHSGLSHSRMFTDLLDGNIAIGDQFFISVMDQRLAYEVDQISVVYPHEVELLRIYPGEDFVTLITCTPITVNSHRLLIRGTRIPYTPAMVYEIEPVITILNTNWRLLIALGAFLLFIMIFSSYQLARILKSRKRKKQAEGYIHPSQPVQAATAYPRYPGYNPRESAKQRKKSRSFRQNIAAVLAILFLAGGLGILLYPQVRRVMYDRYATAIIDDWENRLDDYRANIIARWEQERAALWDTVSGLPLIAEDGLTISPGGEIFIGNLAIGSNGYQLTIGPSGRLYVGNVTTLEGITPSLGPGGELYVNGYPIREYNHHVYIGYSIIGQDVYSLSVRGPEGELYVGGVPVGHYSLFLSVSPDGILYFDGGSGLGGLYISPGGYLSNGADGNLTISNLLLGPDGNPALGEILSGTDGQFNINVGTGDVNVGNLTLGPDGYIYLGNIPLSNISNGNINYDDFDFNLIFGFNPDYDDPFSWLNQQCENYNVELHDTNQAELTDLESMEAVDFSLVHNGGFSEEMIGFLTVERMNIRIPIFAGAHDGNMLRGAAHLTQSSLPVGGINSNAVITAHRGLSRARMFRDIEDMRIGDYIYITNFYQTLRYRVFHTDVIEDYDVDALKIQPGRDIITLKTCHPYRLNHQRYLVFAERVLYD